jgi:hypothetical protein
MQKKTHGLASNLVHLVGKITNLKRLLVTSREHLRFGLSIGRVEVKFLFFWIGGTICYDVFKVYET